VRRRLILLLELWIPTLALDGPQSIVLAAWPHTRIFIARIQKIQVGGGVVLAFLNPLVY
jgi:hypothetical protein